MLCTGTFRDDVGLLTFQTYSLAKHNNHNRDSYRKIVLFRKELQTRF